MKTLNSDEVMLAAHGGQGGDEWVRADVARALYDALETIMVSYPQANELQKTNAAMARAALAAADGEEQ